MSNKRSKHRQASKLSPWLAWGLGLPLLALSILIASVPLDFYQQLLFALFALGFALLIRPEQGHDSRYRNIALILISTIITARYLIWRITESMGWFGSNLDLSAADYFFSFGLLAAEIYAWMVLYFGYFQTIWPLKRGIHPMPPDRSKWPTVDVFIPTYNEPLKVVAPTILAAKNLDWPKNLLRVHVLDDGCRETFKQFALDAGVNYIERHSSEGAKAGNINHALERTSSELVVIFDSDHAPVRSFLTSTVGWFLKRLKLGLLQTPHLFFSPDPVERNLEIFRSVPNEGQLFYGLVQDGNDLWNSTFFCGSCAVMRRKALEDINGIATDTVTEDAHTSLRMHRSRWDSAYLNIPLAAGLATERLSAHVGQRIRWARGMIQIFRMDNPLLGRGLKISQRLSYFNAMFHFFFSLPRLVFLTAPLAFLLLEAHVIHAAAAMIAVYALPHIIQSHIANSSIQGKYRHSFWAEVYETILATHIFWPTIKALFNPKYGKFNVTDKGGIIEKDYFDWDTAMPLFFILLLNLAGFIVGVGRLLWWNVGETDTVIMTMVWTVYNMIILGAALAVAREKKQLRETVRIPREERIEILEPTGRIISGVTKDISIINAGIQLNELPEVNIGDDLNIRLYDGNRYYTFPLRVCSLNGRHMGITFHELNAEQLAKLVYFTHSREHAWDNWYGNCTPSRTLKSFFEVVKYGFIGLRKTLFGDRSLPKGSESHVLTGWLFITAVVVYGIFLAPKSAMAAEFTPPSITQEKPDTSSTRIINFSHLSVESALLLQGATPQASLNFHIRADELVEKATLSLYYSLPPELGFDFDSLDISLNGVILDSIPTSNLSSGEQQRLELLIDPLLINDSNSLSFQLIASNPKDACRNPATALISKHSHLTLDSRTLTLANELSLLPLPFLDPNATEKQIVPFILTAAAAQSPQHLRNTSIIASWLGMKSDWVPLGLPVNIDSIPHSHAIAFLTQKHFPMGIPPFEIQGPGLKIIPNPVAPEKKILVFMGRTEKELSQAIIAFASDTLTLKGSQMDITETVELPSRQTYDAPRWLQTDQPIYFRTLKDQQALTVQGFSTVPIRIDFRLPPDLFAWKGGGIPVQLNYLLTHSGLSKSSSLDINLNNRPVTQIPLFNIEHRPLANNQIKSLIQDITAKDSHTTTASLEGQRLLFLPMEQSLGRNQLEMYFNINPKDDLPNYCEVMFSQDMRALIDERSYFDLTGFHHYARMPDLKLFASHGFPFTRMADLSETQVLLPLNPNATTLQALFELMAMFSAITGHPVTGLSIATGSKKPDKNKDLLLLGTPRNQPLFTLWEDEMPLAPQKDHSPWTVRSISFFEKISAWRTVNEAQKRLSEAEYHLSITPGNTIALFGFQSPLNRHRSAIALASTTPFGLLTIANSLSDDKQKSQISNDVALFSDDTISTFELVPDYYSGELPIWTGLRWQLSNHILYLLMLFAALVFVAAALLHAVLRDKARRRLEFEDD